MTREEVEAVLEGAKMALDLAYSKHMRELTAQSRESVAFWRHEVNHYNRLLAQATQREYKGEDNVTNHCQQH